LSPVYQAPLERIAGQLNVLRFIQGKYTLTYLLQLQRRIDADWSELASNGIHVSSTGQGFGVVVVTVSEGAPSIPALLQQRYGDAVQVSLGQTIRTTATQTRGGPPPYMGGMEVDNVGNTSLYSNDFYYHVCTAGFIGQQFIDGLPYYYIITAGHCFGGNDLVYHVYSAAGTWLPVGQVTQDWYETGSDADTEAAVIRGGYKQATNEIITAEPDVHTVDYLDAAQVDGLSICHSGITTDQSCNFSVNATHVTVVVGQTQPDGSTSYTQLYDQVTACCDSAQDGDSGGPVYHYYQPQAISAEGIMSAAFYSNGNYTGQISYSFIQDVRSDLDMNICTQTPQATTSC